MFRFTIRDVLWLTVVVALAVAWWIEHRRAEHLQNLPRAFDFAFSIKRQSP